MQDQGAFDFGGADTVSGDIDDIIDASGYPQVAIGITARPVTGEIVSGQRLEVGVDHPLVVAVYAANLRRPAGLDR
ncbi:hypothetical protein D3C73_1451330 [compost metagenome]